MRLTDHHRTEIRRNFNRISPDSTTVFEDIPAKKFRNAQESFGQNIEADEEIIYLRDDTLFGSAKDGYFVTTRGIHGKPFLEKPLFIHYEEIQNVTFAKNKIVVACKDSKRYEFPVATGCKKATPMLTETIDYLRKEGFISGSIDSSTDSLSNQQSAQVDNRCSGCGAPNPARGNFCEYCGSALRR